MRNIQKNLISNWKPTCKLIDLIEELPKFCDSFESQVRQGLLPKIGDYILNSYKYNINDFLANPNNICFKIKQPFKNEEEDEVIFREKYMVITTSTFIIFEPFDQKFRNICLINYVGEIFGIDGIKRFYEPNDQYDNLSCFIIRWTKAISPSDTLTCVLCGDEKKLVVKDICDLLLQRKDSLHNKFKLFEKSELININDYEKIIDIKEKIIKAQTDDVIYEQINQIYQKIIEITSSSNNEGFQKYLEKLKKFIANYDKLKSEEKKLKEMQENNRNGGIK